MGVGTWLYACCEGEVSNAMVDSRDIIKCLEILVMYDRHVITLAPLDGFSYICSYASPLQTERYMGHQNLGGSRTLLVSTRRIILLNVLSDPDKPTWVCARVWFPSGAECR